MSFTHDAQVHARNTSFRTAEEFANVRESLMQLQTSGGTAFGPPLTAIAAELQVGGLTVQMRVLASVLHLKY